MQIEALVTYITPMESSRRALAFGSVKTRFKTIFEKLELSAKICFFHELLPPEGD